MNSDEWPVKDYDPQGVHNLCCAIVEQGVEDVLKGDPGAIGWLNSKAFDHWCGWLDIEPNAARCAILQRRQFVKPRYDPAQIQRCVELHTRGRTWREVTHLVFGYHSETLMLALKRYMNEAGYETVRN